MPRLRAARALPLLGFTLVVGVALGTLVGLSVRPVPAPSDLAAPPVPDRAAVTSQPFNDQRTVPVRFTMAPESTVASPGQGRVTSSECRPGRELRSGRSLGRIDETPVLLLRTSVPLYRDLMSGARGRDVRALQQELDRLGLTIKITGYYGSMTTTAVKTLQRRAGALNPTGTIAIDRVVWLPHRSFKPTSCSVRVGNQVAVGSAWAKIAGGLARIDLDLPGGLVAGRRTLSLYGERAALKDANSTDNREFLARIEATPEFTAHQRDGSEEDVTASIALAKPLVTLKVPPAALFGIKGRLACVESGDQVVPVRLAGSGLGASLVTAATPLTFVDLGSAISANACEAGS